MSNTSSNAMNYDQKPLSVADWIVVFLLLGIPVLGIILVIYWSFGENVNINKKNFSKAMLLLFVLTFALAVIFALLFGHIISEINPYYKLYEF